MSSPKVSIILPVNRDDGFLKDSILSLLNQVFKDFEILVIANNTSDELWEYIEELQKLDSRIKIFRVKLGGLVFALNYAISIAKGKYIARMDADDISLEQRIITQVEYLDNNPNISILGTQIQYINELGDKLGQQASQLPSNFFKIRKIAYYKCPLYHPTVMYRKDDILKLGGYKYGFYGEDYELWLRAIHEGFEIANLNEVLLYYRVHANQVSNTSRIKNLYIAQMLWIFLKKYKNYKYFFGILLQKNFFQYLIVKSSKVRKKVGL
ncbi:glycosyltransferase [Acinetobacter lactucae]|uniref:glycosyltransferase n=1 Tax=Acinetobacter lactucae TaxID=1785128 RepID=UPI000F77F720|nr:glycosyltransferase [Acinetobacter lactucae]RSO33702.1 glycosyltransferase [Acinetobacter lactucae]